MSNLNTGRLKNVWRTVPLSRAVCPSASCMVMFLSDIEPGERYTLSVAVYEVFVKSIFIFTLSANTRPSRSISLKVPKRRQWPLAWPLMSEVNASMNGFRKPTGTRLALKSMSSASSIGNILPVILLLRLSSPVMSASNANARASLSQWPLCRHRRWCTCCTLWNQREDSGSRAWVSW